MPRDVRKRPARQLSRRIRHNYSYEVEGSYNGPMNQARVISWLKEQCAKQVPGRALRLTMQAANSKKLKDKYNYNIRRITCTECTFCGRGLCALSSRKMRLRATPASAHGDFLWVYRKPTEGKQVGLSENSKAMLRKLMEKGNTLRVQALIQDHQQYPQPETLNPNPKS